MEKKHQNQLNQTTDSIWLPCLLDKIGIFEEISLDFYKLAAEKSPTIRVRQPPILNDNFKLEYLAG